MGYRDRHYCLRSFLGLPLCNTRITRPSFLLTSQMTPSLSYFAILLFYYFLKGRVELPGMLIENVQVALGSVRDRLISWMT